MITHSNSGVLAPRLVKRVLPPTDPQCTILGLPWVRKEIFMQLPEPPGSPISQADHFRSWWPGRGWVSGSMWLCSLRQVQTALRKGAAKQAKLSWDIREATSN